MGAADNGTTDGSLTCDVEGKANEPTACVVRRRLRYSPHSLARLFTHTSIPDSIPSPLSLRSEGGPPIRIPRRLHNTAPHSERGADRGVRRSGRKDGRGCIVHLGVLAGGVYSVFTHPFFPPFHPTASEQDELGERGRTHNFPI